MNQEINDANVSKLFTLVFDYANYFRQATEGDRRRHDIHLLPDAGLDPAQQTNIPLKLQCTGVSWNATGSVLAVSYPFSRSIAVAHVIKP